MHTLYILLVFLLTPKLANKKVGLIYYIYCTDKNKKQKRCNAKYKNYTFKIYCNTLYMGWGIVTSCARRYHERPNNAICNCSVPHELRTLQVQGI